MASEAWIEIEEDSLVEQEREPAGAAPRTGGLEALEMNLEATQASMFAVALDLREKYAELEAREAELRRGWARLEAREAAVEKQARAVKAAQTRLEEEKAAMTKPGVGMDDLLSLNFGGEKVVQVKRSLLLEFESSRLAELFSGRHDDELVRDKEGNFFLDYSPRVMMPLVEMLRSKRDGAASYVPTSLPADEKVCWDGMLQAMRIRECLPSTFFSGIQCDVDLDSLHGWTTVLCKPYAHKTSDADFELPEELCGGTVLLAAKRRGSKTLSLAAMGHYDVVTARTEGQDTKKHNGLFWYFKAGASVGFAPTAKVQLDRADWQRHKGPEACKLRLSWLLTGRGGRRAGTDMGLNSSTDWEKVIMACPQKLPLQES